MINLSAVEHPKAYVSVHGKKMAYVELGVENKDSVPVLFLHGNPTSSYLWRNIMPHVAGERRAIAPDLIGMGDSEKLENSGPGRYRFIEHSHYLDRFIETVLPEGPIYLCLHDWGSVLGFYWARRYPQRVKGICFMEGIVGPLKSWDEWPLQVKDVFRAMRSAAGEEMVLKRNIFVEAVLTGAVLRKLADEEMAVYRRPYLNEGEDRRPTLAWPREIPIEGEPADVVEIAHENGMWMKESAVPKLFIDASPGAILRGNAREFVRSWPNLAEVQVAGSHFIQEDSPHEIGEALSGWIAGIED